MEIQEQSLTELDKIFNNLTNYLKGESEKSTLRENWVWLQMYATHLLRLPNTSTSLQSSLKIKSSIEITGYKWFTPMLRANQDLDTVSKFFFSDVFDKMTSLGNGLQNYSTEVTGEDSVFTLISSLVKPTDGSVPDPNSALDILSDLKTTAQQNASLAGDIKSNLTTFKAKLEKVNPNLVFIKKQVEKDDRTSMTTINKLNGGVKINGSIKHLIEEIRKDHEEYISDLEKAGGAAVGGVVFVCIIGPVGFVAAEGFAVYYAIKAKNMSDKIESLEKELDEANEKIELAVTVQNVVKTAEDSLKDLIPMTEMAISKTTYIQNSWTGIVSSLDFISAKVSSSIKMKDGEEKLAAINAIVYYMKKAQQKWTVIQPLIDEMVKDPYITVDPKSQTISEFFKKTKEASLAQ